LRRFNAPQTFYLTNVLASICYFGCALSNCCHPPNAPWKFRSSESPCHDKRVGQVVIRKPLAVDLPPHAHCWFFVFGVSSSALSLCVSISIYLRSKARMQHACVFVGSQLSSFSFCATCPSSPQPSSCTSSGHSWLGTPATSSHRRRLGGRRPCLVVLGSACIKVHRSSCRRLCLR
jgi:hypothetical protein